MNDHRQKHILECLEKWGNNNADIRAIVIAGSIARNDNTADFYSDVDAIVIVKKIKKYKETFRWAEAIEKPISFYYGITGNLFFVRRVYFDDGLGLDINFVSEKAIRFAYGLAVLKQRAGWLLKLLPGFLLTMFNQAIYFYTDYVCRGKRFLVDRAGLSRKLNKIEQIFPFKADNEISLGRLQNAIDEFWQNAWRMAIKLYRNELFIAKYECDHAMVSNLLLLITVYTKFKNGKNLETWNKGKNIEKWAPPFIVEGIRQIYSRYDGGDTWRGLMATMNLFDKVYNLLIQEEDFQSLKSPGETINKWVNDLKCKHEVEVI